jgi:hypothetical protein
VFDKRVIALDMASIVVPEQNTEGQFRRDATAILKELSEKSG